MIGEGWGGHRMATAPTRFQVGRLCWRKLGGVALVLRDAYAEVNTLEDGNQWCWRHFIWKTGRAWTILGARRRSIFQLLSNVSNKR